MRLDILRAGLQTTIQGAIRSGFRHYGVPWSGPADPLSHSLANRLVGNLWASPALETTLTGVRIGFSEAVMFAVTGADTDISLNHTKLSLHLSYQARAGDVLELGPVRHGCRNYIAFSGVLSANEFLGSFSTYLPGKFGGFGGRALKDGDQLEVMNVRMRDRAETPVQLRPFFNDRFVLQVTEGPDLPMLEDQSLLFSEQFKASPRSSRMGVQIKGPDIRASGTEALKSAGVFPGAVQCPPDGHPFLLLADCQTTGGYPHILNVIRGDRFQLGQIRQGAEIRFVLRGHDYAVESYRKRSAMYEDWLMYSALR